MAELAVAVDMELEVATENVREDSFACSTLADHYRRQWPTCN